MARAVGVQFRRLYPQWLEDRQGIGKAELSHRFSSVSALEFLKTF